ncbi:MAG TPA: penicillin acylase family protein [Actinotalea sp.]|nr:penicillin acylase family protein [Actinotalea sp.]
MPGSRVTRRGALRSLAVLAGVLVVALVAVVALVGVVVRRPLPDHDGTADLPGLGAEVQVLRDARGVPSIYADTTDDLYRAQGYVHAQDRFFEMDLRRHVTAGRLSELVGPDEDALAADTVIRTLGWRRVAEQEWDLLSRDTRDHLEAYAAGVNAYLEQRSAQDLAVEYTVLGLRVAVGAPEPWTPIDSLAWLKAMAWDARSNDVSEVARAQSYATVRDVDRVDELFPAPLTGDEIIPAAAVETAAAAAPTPLEPDLQRALDLASRALAAVPALLGRGEGTGSNSWVVAGEHTVGGRPILATDPHLAISAPGVWSQVGLYCRSVSRECPVQVSGFGFAGLPGVVTGHNADLAWGLTSMGADVADLFLERTRPEDGTYLRDGKQVPLTERTEVIEVAGGDPVEIQVRSTVHGPIVSGVLDIDWVAGAPVPDGGRGTPEVSLAWTALDPGRTADALFALMGAADATDVRAAAALFDVPTQNIVFATTDGHIGYQAPGRVPVRARVVDGPVPSDGSWPRPGWDSRYDWLGYVEAERMPSVLDPAQGYVVAANQPVTPPGVGPFLTTDWDAGYRASRIGAELERAVAAGEPIDGAATSALQDDAWSPYAEALLPALLAAPVQDAFTLEAVDLLRDWDRVQSTDSAAAAYFAAVWSDLLRSTFADELPPSQWPDGGSRWLAVVTALLDDPGNPWWDDRSTVTVVESRDEVLVQTLTAARLELTVALGKDPTAWTWGRLHVAAPEHAVLGDADVPGVLRRLVNPQPVAVDGGSSIIEATSWDAASGTFDVTSAPAMRMVVDLSDLDASTWVNLTGSSGHPASVHYTDQLDAWASGRSYPWPFTATAVEEAATSTLTLLPAEG